MNDFDQFLTQTSKRGKRMPIEFELLMPVLTKTSVFPFSPSFLIHPTVMNILFYNRAIVFFYYISKLMFFFIYKFNIDIITYKQEIINTYKLIILTLIIIVIMMKTTFVILYSCF
jgi:hypothetical protein